MNMCMYTYIHTHKTAHCACCLAKILAKPLLVTELTMSKGHGEHFAHFSSAVISHSKSSSKQTCQFFNLVLVSFGWGRRGHTYTPLRNSQKTVRC